MPALSRKVVIEARVNEYAGRAPNPNVPWTAAEIASDVGECAAAGASIAHFHARANDGGAAHDYDAYRDVVRGIAGASEILVHPTLGMYSGSSDPRERFRHILRLAEDGLTPDIVPLDMASTNVDRFDASAKAFRSDESVYLNTTGTLRYFAETARERSIKPYGQVYGIPSLRAIDAFAAAGYLSPPLFLSLLLTEGEVLAAHPGSKAGLDAFLPFLPRRHPVVWTVTLFGGSLLPLIPHIVAAGGHVSLGLGDHPYPELGRPTNAAVVAEAARIIRECGAAVASPEEARDILGC